MQFLSINFLLYNFLCCVNTIICLFHKWFSAVLLSLPNIAYYLFNYTFLFTFYSVLLNSPLRLNTTILPFDFFKKNYTTYPIKMSYFMTKFVSRETLHWVLIIFFPLPFIHAWKESSEGIMLEDTQELRIYLR